MSRQTYFLCWQIRISPTRVREAGVSIWNRRQKEFHLSIIPIQCPTCLAKLIFITLKANAKKGTI